jgi:hypothetical protein
MNVDKEYTMKVIGKRTSRRAEGFTEDLNKFLKTMPQLREKKRLTPRGVIRFKTFNEADEWWKKILI